MKNRKFNNSVHGVNKLTNKKFSFYFNDNFRMKKEIFMVNNKIYNCKIWEIHSVFL